MGCCSSTQEVVIDDICASLDVSRHEPHPVELSEAEIAAAEEPDTLSFLGAIRHLRDVAYEDSFRRRSTDTVALEDACLRLQQHNARLKDYIATLDAKTVREAMKGEEGFQMCATCKRTDR